MSVLKVSIDQNEEGNEVTIQVSQSEPLTYGQLIDGLTSVVNALKEQSENEVDGKEAQPS